MKFCVIHPLILGTYFPLPEVKLREKDEARSFEE
jgi:hypothetical protein